MILAGDIGGTNTRLALFDSARGLAQPVVETVFPSREHPSLDEIVAKFLSAQRFPVERAAFGVAGVVKKGRSEATNLAWLVDSKQLAARLGTDSVGLINDLEANAYGLSVLSTDDFRVINRGAADAAGNQAIISAGTGLGEAGLYWDGQQHRPFATEGGHADFAPRDELELELARYLRARFDHISAERVISGPGLLNIYHFLRDTGRGEEPEWLIEQMREGDPSAVISRVAIEGTSSLCERALDLFVSLYAAEAGNFALKVMARGGVFVGGGIAPKIIPKMIDSAFLTAFAAKGRLRPLLEEMPVRIVLNDNTALFGAARYATLIA